VRHQEQVLSLFAVGASAHRVHLDRSDIRRERFYLPDPVRYRASLAPHPPRAFHIVLLRLFLNRGTNVSHVFAGQRRLGGCGTAGK